MNIKKSIGRGWEILQSQEAEEHGIRYLKLIGDESFIVDVGLVNPHKHRSILFSFNCDDEDLYIPDIALEGFSLSKFEYDDDKKYNLSMKLVQQEVGENDIFMTICTDLATFLHKNEDSGEKKFNHLIERIFTWVEFLKNKKSSGLSLREQLGLIAELLVFEQLKAKSVKESDVVTSWTGPERAAKDYIKKVNAIEVKCKLDSESAIKISNLEQLNGADHENLVLCIVSLREDSDSTLTLNSIVLRIASSFTDTSILKVFLHKLYLVGYFFKDSKKYDTSFSVHSFNVYRVLDNFPRLVPSNVEPGIVNVKYSLNVDSIAKYRIDDSELTKGWK